MGDRPAGPTTPQRRTGLGDETSHRSSEVESALIHSPYRNVPLSEQRRRVHIVSWNVASWVTTLSQIKAQHGSLKAWADRHFVDILCLQEVKGNYARLEKEPAVFGAQEPGFDSFFALCKPPTTTNNSSANKVGFNGVATFARKGLTRSANSRPLGVPELDAQGRCLETDHGAFVLFNLYAPYDGHGGESLATKMKVLLRLRERMRRVREETGKPVILAGDLNARYRVKDSSREMRTLDVRKLLASSSTGDDTKEPAIVQVLRNALTLLDEEGRDGLTRIKQAIRQLETQPFGDRGKFRVFARHPRTNELKRINASQTLWTREEVDQYRPFDGVALDGDISERETFGMADRLHSSGYPVAELNERNGDVRWVARMEDCITLEDFRVLTQELLDVRWQEADFEQFADYEAGGWLLCGKLCTAAWMEALLRDDGMKDSFVEINPDAHDRFTVWCQQTNDRFKNFGSRIDYILVDPSLEVAPNEIGLYGCTCRSREECKSKHLHCADGESCALSAAIAYGRWKPAPFQGGGLPPGSKADYETQFRPCPHTGILYTPPTFSDHVATSCVLTGMPDVVTNRAVELSKDQDTAATRPYAKQSSILGFFQTGSKKQKMA